MSSSNGYATKEQWFSANKRRFRDVVVSGMKVRIRSLTEGEWADFDIQNYDFENGGRSEQGVRTSDARLVICAVVDADGNPVFNALDTAHLMQLDASVIRPLVRAIREHCGVLHDVEDAEKNLETTPAGGSPTSC